MIVLLLSDVYITLGDLPWLFGMTIKKYALTI